ncbi:MAG: hypothetical protein JW841_07350 [Deltaproteobacteria bacterium]|nr:hypothetical protein [Deltaproteobacteria bacterium]
MVIKQHEFHPLIKKIISDFELRDKSLVMPEVKLQSWAVKISELNKKNRELIIKQLFIVAMRLSNVSFINSVTQQILELAIMILGKENAVQLFLEYEDTLQKAQNTFDIKPAIKNNKYGIRTPKAKLKKEK